jgi:hypothetical protein
MRTCTDKLMLNLCSGIRFIIRSENRKLPIRTCPDGCHPCGLDFFVEADSLELIQTAKSKICLTHLPIHIIVPVATAKFRLWLPIVDPSITSFSDSHNPRRPNTNEWDSLVIQLTLSWSQNKSIDSAHLSYRTAYYQSNLRHASPHDPVTRLSSESCQDYDHEHFHRTV